MIENSGVMRASTLVPKLGWEGCGRESQAPHHDAGGIEIDAAGGQDAANLSMVQGEVARGHGHTKPGDAGAAAGAGHVVEARLGVEVMAAAGASANGGTPAAAAVGEDVAAGANDQRLRAHNQASVEDGEGGVKRKNEGCRYESNRSFPKWEQGGKSGSTKQPHISQKKGMRATRSSAVKRSVGPLQHRNEEHSQVLPFVIKGEYRGTRQARSPRGGSGL